LREAHARSPEDLETIQRLERRAEEREKAFRVRVASARRASVEKVSRFGADDFSTETTGTSTATSAEPSSTTFPPQKSLVDRAREKTLARNRSVAPEGSVRRLVEGDKGPGVFFPSAEFEEKFAKSAGKILKNMRRHAEYVASLAASGPGGVGGMGGPFGKG
jgi:hypothetical protein